jgi:uncharacterized membrane protein YfcA
MEYIIICLAAFFTSALTLFSGFGLGTMLMPVFALFFPIDIAIALTAIVHLLNNLFKLGLLGKYADRSVVYRFGLPAIVSAYIGAKLLNWFSDLKPIFTYQLFSHAYTMSPVKLIIAVLIIIFALFEIIPSLIKISFSKKLLPVGGIFSGFFGGLSGHQGALRSAFLLRCGLTKESFIATGIFIACIVDIARMIGYSSHFTSSAVTENLFLLIAVILSAFLGAYLSRRLLKKVTMSLVQIMVSILLFIIAIGLGLGII